MTKKISLLILFSPLFFFASNSLAAGSACDAKSCYSMMEERGALQVRKMDVNGKQTIWVVALDGFSQNHTSTLSVLEGSPFLAIEEVHGRLRIDRIVSLDPANGRVLWVSKNRLQESFAGAAFAGRSAYVTGNDKGRFQIEKIDLRSGASLWVLDLAIHEGADFDQYTFRIEKAELTSKGLELVIVGRDDGAGPTYRFLIDDERGAIISRNP